MNNTDRKCDCSHCRDLTSVTVSDPDEYGSVTIEDPRIELDDLVDDAVWPTQGRQVSDYAARVIVNTVDGVGDILVTHAQAIKLRNALDALVNKRLA